MCEARRGAGKPHPVELGAVAFFVESLYGYGHGGIIRVDIDLKLDHDISERGTGDARVSGMQAERLVLQYRWTMIHRIGREPHLLWPDD